MVFGLFGPKLEIRIIYAIEEYMSTNDQSKAAFDTVTTLQKERAKVTSLIGSKVTTASIDAFIKDNWEEYENWRRSQGCCIGITIEYDVTHRKLEDITKEWNELKSKILAYSSGIPIIGRVIDKLLSIKLKKVNEKMPSKEEIKRIKDRDLIEFPKKLKKLTQKKSEWTKFKTENKGLTPEFLKYSDTSPGELLDLQKKFRYDKQKIFDQIIYQNIFYIQLLIDEAAKGKSHEQNEIDAKSTLIKFFNDLQKQLRGVKGGMRTRKYRSKSKSKGTRRC
jgi:hypothetical protein